MPSPPKVAASPSSAVLAIARLVRANELDRAAKSARRLAAQPGLSPAAGALADAAESGNMLHVVASLTRLASLVDGRRAA